LYQNWENPSNEKCKKNGDKCLVHKPELTQAKRGHFLCEEAPTATAQALIDFFTA
jgi:hypothetical protein